MMQLLDLAPANLFDLFRIRVEQSENPAFAERDQFAIGEQQRAATEDIRRRRAVRRPMFVTVPHQLPGLEFHAPKMRVWLVASAECIEITVQIDRRHPK